MSDLYVQPTLDGADVIIDRKGNPVMTGGLDNAVYLSAFVSPWWANRIESAELQYLSDVQEATSEVLALQSARDVVESVRRALSWMTTRGIAVQIEIDSEIVSDQLLDIPITVTEPDGTRTRFGYGLNWSAQKVHTITERRR